MGANRLNPSKGVEYRLGSSIIKTASPQKNADSEAHLPARAFPPTRESASPQGPGPGMFNIVHWQWRSGERRTSGEERANFKLGLTARDPTWPNSEPRRP